MSIYKDLNIQQQQVLQLEIKTEDRQLSYKLRELKKQVMQINFLIIWYCYVGFGERFLKPLGLLAVIDQLQKGTTYVMGNRGALKLASLEQTMRLYSILTNLGLWNFMIALSNHELGPFQQIDCFLEVIYLLLIGINRRNRFFRRKILSVCITSHHQQYFICILMALKSWWQRFILNYGKSTPPN